MTLESCTCLQREKQRLNVYKQIPQKCREMVQRSNTLSMSRSTSHLWKNNTLLTSIFPLAHCSSVIGNSGESLQSDRLPGFARQRSQIDLKKDEITAFKINQYLSNESGIERLLDAYKISNFPGFGMFSQEHTQKINNVVFYTGIFGFIGSLVTASIKHSNLDGKPPKNLSQTQALMKGLYVEQAIPRKVLGDTARGGSLFLIHMIGFLHLPYAIAVYRNETTMFDFIIPSVLVYSLHNLSKCPITMLKNVGKGLAFGALYGSIVISFLKNEGLTQEERHNEEIKRKLSAGQKSSF